MNKLNLTAVTSEQERIKEYLENNVSDVLVEKINNGVRIEKYGMTLINKKDLDGFMKYAYEEARTLAKGQSCACVSADVVFGWAVHYFEEDSIEGTLYNEGGSVYSVSKPVPSKPRKDIPAQAPKKTEEKPAVKSKKDKAVLPENQFSLFDMLG